MKKRAAHRKIRRHASSPKHVSRSSDSQYVILVRSWVFLVLFAIMLGVGVMVGNYINNQLNGGVPLVAGATTDR